jgi:hypothetical protein
VNENKSSEATPDQLLHALELQLAARRIERQRSAGNRTAFRVGSIFLILGGCGAALFFLQMAVADLPDPEEVKALQKPPAKENREMIEKS